jgi:hypothetical protein
VLALALALALALLGVDDMLWKELLDDPIFYGGSATLRLWSSCPSGLHRAGRIKEQTWGGGGGGRRRRR